MKKFYSKDFRLGLLGGGQLGRMFIQEAINYDLRVSVLDPSADAPCAAIAETFILGDFADYDTVYSFGKNVDILTIEIEHVNIEALEKLEKDGVKIYPSPALLKMVKDKGLQKEFYERNRIPTAPFSMIAGIDDLRQDLVFPFVQKLRKGGYDGKGVQAIRCVEDLERAFDAPSIIEDMVEFDKEIAVIIARNVSGETKTYPIVEMEFNPEANLVEFLFSPANVSDGIREEALALANKIAEACSLTGILAIEMFVTTDGRLLVNEMAPRPHNSGHHTIEACPTSQYEQHIRAILNLSLGDTKLMVPAVMINLLGEKGQSGPAHYEGLEEALSWPGVHIHLYGKSETRPFRKMGHITVTSDNLKKAQDLARKVASTVKVLAK